VQEIWQECWGLSENISVLLVLLVPAATTAAASRCPKFITQPLYHHSGDHTIISILQSTMKALSQGKIELCCAFSFLPIDSFYLVGNVPTSSLCWSKHKCFYSEHIEVET
jgi:hypothetical protein